GRGKLACRRPRHQRTASVRCRSSATLERCRQRFCRPGIADTIPGCLHVHNRPMALLEIQDVTRRFGDFTAVDGVNLSIEAGEFFTLLGPSGCGKTTLLRMVAGFDLPDGGRILLNGDDLADRPPEDRPVRTVFQSYALFPHMTVQGNVAFPLKMARTPPGEIADKVAGALADVRLSGFGGRFPHELSGGQKQ